MKIFWSWQNDADPKRHRHFIKEALAAAISKVGDDLDLTDADRPELDHDTKGEFGMVDIVDSVLRKIDASAVFVADLTPVGSTAKGKALPNPNVLIELGWAMKKPGSERVIGVVNTADAWKPDSLPFDIRNRRVLTYELPDGSSKGRIAAAKQKLTADLGAAIAQNLTAHLDEAVAAREVVGVPSKADDRSLWASAGDEIVHSHALTGGAKTHVRFPNGPRAYIRIMPAGWREGPPTVSDVRGLEGALVVWPPSDYANVGDYGATSDGYVLYWITGTGTSVQEAVNVTHYFDKTGEFWIVHGTAVAAKGDRSSLRVESVIGGWSRALRASLAVFRRFQAHDTVKVEVGVVGINDVRWPGQFLAESPTARKNTFVLEEKSRTWTRDTQVGFLLKSYNGLRDLFTLDKVSLSDFAQLLDHCDRDWNKTG